MSKAELKRVALVAAFNDDGWLLLGQRRDSGRWTLPGGHLNEGEDPRAGAARELREEAGVTTDELDKIDTRTNGNVELHTFKAYIDSDATITGERDPDEEVEEWLWVDVTDGVPLDIANNCQGPADPDKNVLLDIFGMKKSESALVKTHPIRGKHQDQLPGGLADEKKPEDFDAETLTEGTRVEMEHVADTKLAREIAMDHLIEDRDYYKKLKTMESTSLEKMALASIKPGKAVQFAKTPHHDYSHLLAPGHEDKRLLVASRDLPGISTKGIRATLFTRDGKELGSVTGTVGHGNLKIGNSEIASEHQGQGHGKALYEAMMAHAYHNHGARQVSGYEHSTSAGRVHQSLAEKHGFDYEPTKGFGDGPEKPYDARHGYYDYAIKSEASLVKMMRIPGFPKLGIEDRRETPYVDWEPNDYKTATKLAQMGRNPNVPLSVHTKGQQFMTPARIDADQQIRHALREETGRDYTGPLPPHVVNQLAQRIVGDTTVRAMGAVATIPPEEASWNPKDVERPPIIAYAHTNAAREALIPGSTPGNPGDMGDITTKLHEDVYGMMTRVEHKYGRDARQILAYNLWHSIPPDLRNSAGAYAKHINAGLAGSPKEYEEHLAILHNYLNDPRERYQFHGDRRVRHTPEEARAIHRDMKSAFKRLVHNSREVDQSWLTGWKFGPRAGRTASGLKSPAPETRPKLPDVDMDTPEPPKAPTQQPMAKADEWRPNVWWHGTPSGDLRGGPNGLHVGTKKAAEEALHSRIGVPAEGAWDGTREYGKTLLAGNKRLREQNHPQANTGYYAMGKQEDHYPDLSSLPHFGDGTPVQPTHKPNIVSVNLTGPMSNTLQNPYDDFKANGYMRAQVTKGRARRGYYYKNVGEDAGSISAVVPPGGAHLSLLGKSEPVVTCKIRPWDEDKLAGLHGNEVDRLLLHPDVNERKLALRLKGVTEANLIRALDDENSEVRGLAMNHPAMSTHGLLALMKMPGREDLQLKAIHRPEVGPAHLHALYHTHKESPVRTRAAIMAAIGAHADVGPDLLDTMVLDRNAGAVVEHKHMTSESLARLVEDHFNAPDDLVARNWARRAMRHPALPRELLAVAMKEADLDIKLAAMCSPNIPEELALDIVARGQLPAHDGEAFLRHTLIDNPSCPTKAIEMATRDRNSIVAGAARKQLGLNKFEANFGTWLGKATDPAHFKAIAKASDPEGRALVDHTPELTAHPPGHATDVDVYRTHVINSPEPMKKLAAKKDSGITKKLLYQISPDHPTHGGGKFMVKPYHERVIQRTKHWNRYPHQGWSEMTNQALYHAADIGHLHQRVHVSEHNMGEGHEKEPALVVRMDSGFKNVGDDPWSAMNATDDVRHDARKLVLMDFLTNNLDRHGGNLLTGDYRPDMEEGDLIPHKIMAVDHSRNFGYLNTWKHRLIGQAAPRHQELNDSLAPYMASSSLALINPHDVPQYKRDMNPTLDAYKPVFDWWGQVSDKVKATMNQRIQQIRDPEVKAHILRNFNERTKFLDERAHFGIDNYGLDWYNDKVPMYRPHELTDDEKEALRYK